MPRFLISNGEKSVVIWVQGHAQDADIPGWKWPRTEAWLKSICDATETVFSNALAGEFPQRSDSGQFTTDSSTALTLYLLSQFAVASDRAALPHGGEDDGNQESSAEG